MTSEKEKAIDILKSHGFDTPHLDFKGAHIWARVVDCYDGDTCTVVFPWNQQINKFTVRLMGIDTCEQNGPQKERAVLARNRLLQLIVGEEGTIELSRTYKRTEIRALLDENVFVVWMCCKGMDKYGRLLCELYSSDETCNTVSFSDILIHEGHGVGYDGCTKLVP